MTKKEKIKFQKSIRNLAVKIAGGCIIQNGKDGLTYKEEKDCPHQFTERGIAEICPTCHEVIDFQVEK